MELLKLLNIDKTYGKGDNKVQALKNINISINKGELIAVVGTSGSGKSTLLNLLGFLDRPTNGKYILENRDVSTLKGLELAKLRNTHFGFVVQNFSLINDYTVFQNIQIPLEYAGKRLKNRHKIVNELLFKLDLQDKKNKTPKELSGGQCQRVAIARALANNPEVILADEPTGSLDQKTGQAVLDILKQLNSEGKTIIIVTHDPKIAAQCTRIINIEDGIIKKDTVDIPAN